MAHRYEPVLGLYDAVMAVADPYPDRTNFEGADPTLAGLGRTVR